MSFLFGPRTLADTLRRFFGRDLTNLPVLNRSFAPAELPNLQIAIDMYVQERFYKLELIGYTGSFMGMMDSLADLVGRKSRAMGMFFNPKVGPVVRRMVDIDVDQQMSCVERGVYLIRTEQGHLAVHLRRDAVFQRGGLELEVMSDDEDLASRFLDTIRSLANKHSVYRGKILSLGCEGEALYFHRFPNVKREDIVLPEATMNLLERNTVRFFQHAEVLRRSGRSVKRGILLHGKPGTGKTFTAKWLGQSLKGGTVILMTGEELWLIKECCQLARALAPALVIMEDVDLIASERNEHKHPATQISLHQLLNEMDGLTSDAEVIFLLTTNRPNIIEEAIAMRPGRVDQAIEFPLPDADCRRRLITLYGRGLSLEINDMDRIVTRTEGASPAFIQELLRKSALIAAEENSRHNGLLRVTDPHIHTALEELVFGGGELTRNLLGFHSDSPT